MKIKLKINANKIANWIISHLYHIVIFSLALLCGYLLYLAGMAMWLEELI